MTSLETLVLFIARVTVVFALAFMMAALLRRSSAAVRHRVWAFTIVAVLLLPLLNLALPSVPVSWLPTVSPAADLTIVSGNQGETIKLFEPTLAEASDGSEVPAAVSAGESAETNQFTLPSVSDLGDFVVPLWALGSLMVLFVRARGIVLRRSIWNRSVTPAEETEAISVAGALKIGRTIEVRQTNEVSVPMTWGTLRPAVLIPEAFQGWSSDRRRQVLFHELAHIARKDAAVQALGGLTVALFWFHPLAWLAERKLRAEAERACDDMVLLSGERPSSYAENLIEVARGMRRARALPLAAALPIARRAELPERIAALLDPSRSRKRASGGETMLSSVLALALVIPISVFSCGVERNGYLVGSLHETGPSAESIFATPPYEGLCGLDDDGQTSVYSKKGRTTLEMSAGGCRLEIDVRGHLRLGERGQQVIGLDPGGSLSVTEKTAAGERSLLILPDGTGVDYRYSVDGERKDWDEEGHAWLARVLPELYRSTTLDAKRRVARMLADGGASAVLDEVELIRSDHVQGVYLRHLIDRAKLDDGNLSRLFSILRSSISSDYAKGQILQQLAAAGFDSALDSEWAAVVRSMESDYEISNALRARFDNGADRSSIAAGLRVARDLSSSYELSRVAVSAIENLETGDSLPVALFDLVSTISSDYEKGVVLGEIVRRERLSHDEIAAILQLASGISSSYESAGVLVALVARHPLDSTMRNAYLRVADGISSQYERDRAAAALAQNFRLSGSSGR